VSPPLPPGARYLPGILPPAAAEAHLAALLDETPWEHHTFTLFGRTVPMPRLIQMYGPHGYHYSGVHHPPRPLTPRLQALLHLASEAAGAPFNSVLLNLYRDGQDSMGWHSDDDYPHAGNPAIGSLSLGATRRFRFRKKTAKPETLSLDLETGSVLVMDGAACTEWQHALPKSARPMGPRVNLTFRFMAGP